VLRRAGLLAEAAALGAARLMPGDPALQVRFQFSSVHMHRVLIRVLIAACQGIWSNCCDHACGYGLLRL